MQFNMLMFWPLETCSRCFTTSAGVITASFTIVAATPAMQVEPQEVLHAVVC